MNKKNIMTAAKAGGLYLVAYASYVLNSMYPVQDAVQQTNDFCKDNPEVCDKYVPPKPYSKQESMPTIFEKSAESSAWGASAVGAAVSVFLVLLPYYCFSNRDAESDGRYLLADDYRSSDSNEGYSVRAFKKDLAKGFCATTSFLVIGFSNLLFSSVFATDVICQDSGDNVNDFSCDATFPNATSVEQEKVSSLANVQLTRTFVRQGTYVLLAETAFLLLSAMAGVAIFKAVRHSTKNCSLFGGESRHDDSIAMDERSRNHLHYARTLEQKS